MKGWAEEGQSSVEPEYETPIRSVGFSICDTEAAKPGTGTAHSAKKWDHHIRQYAPPYYSLSK
jgi:hypothetical protein